MVPGPDVRSQDAKLFMRSVLANAQTQKLAWPALRERWAQLQKKTGQFGGNTVVVSGLGEFCDARTAGEVKRFFTDPQGPGRRADTSAVSEQINECSSACGAQPAKLTAWLKTSRRRNEPGLNSHLSRNLIMRKNALPLVLMALALVPAAAQRASTPQQQQPGAPASASGIDPAAMDPGVDACTDSIGSPAAAG